MFSAICLHGFFFNFKVLFILFIIPVLSLQYQILIFDMAVIMTIFVVQHYLFLTWVNIISHLSSYQIQGGHMGLCFHIC